MVEQVPLVLRFDPPPPKRPPEEVHAAAMARGAACKKCPLFGCDRGPVMPTIRPGAPLIAIGEAPGINEVREREGFVGASGHIMNSALAKGGLSRRDISVSNTILCQPPEGGNFTDYISVLRAAHAKQLRRWERTWLGRPGDAELTTAKRHTTAQQRYEKARGLARSAGESLPEPPPELVLPQDCCRPRLERDMVESSSLVTLALGRQALDQTRSIFGLEVAKKKSEDSKPKVASLKKQHGAPVLLPDGRVLIATYHPAFAMREKCEYMPVIEDNITRAALIARRNGKIEWSEPDYILSPDLGLIKRTLHRFLSVKAEVTVDIETDGIDPHLARIRCVGLGARIFDEEVIIVVPFNHTDGTPWWDEETKVELALLLRRVLDECPLIFQNGQFDTTVLLRVGLMTDRSKAWDDTLLLHHDTPDNDLPHDLGFITRRYFEVPLWKENVDHKSVDAQSDFFLHLYNARDVLATMRVVVPLRALVERWDTTRQYATDRAMVVKTRDMSELGLFCNEWLRGKYSQQLNTSCAQLSKEFQELAGRSINPRSPPQLRELFYADWGYVPVVATDGYEWEVDVDDLEDGSTSNQALTRLQSERILLEGDAEKRKRHDAAVEKLLEFRAIDKLRGTYTDNLRTYDVDCDRYFSSYNVGWADPVKAVDYNVDLDQDVEIIIPRRRGLSLVRTTYKGFVVPTGRLASGDPVNFQNIPKNARGGLNLRDLYVAPPGHVLVGADYEQIEARLYAVIAGDQLLLHAIHGWDKVRGCQGHDIHSLNAASLFCKPGEDLMDRYAWVLHKPKDEKAYIRTVAKRFCFGLIYGAKWPKVFSVMVAERNKGTGERLFPDLTELDCQEWEANWHRIHPETRAWHERCHRAYSEFGFTGVPMLDYRKRFFPGGVAQENAIPNLTIQGSAASIANQALLKLSDEVPYRGWSPWSGVVLQVHDYLGVVVPVDRADEAAKIVEKCMYYEYEGMHFNAQAEKTWTWGAQ
ncbi:DNA polymerase I-like protein [Virus Rctr197k]|nr:DNA polymerase I-like protein [Virus Rctr197k]